MYSLFNSPPLFNPGLNKVTGWNETRRAVLDEMNKLARHYRFTSQWSRNTNVLNRILEALDISPHKDKNYVAQMAREDFSQMVAQHGMYSSIVTTRNPPVSQFYNQQCLELVVYDDSYFDANAAKANWGDLEPVKILEHPFDDIHLSLPDDNYRSLNNQQGLAIISINVAMLVVQFHYWVEAQTGLTNDVGGQTAQFITRYPIFNAMKSHLDIAIRNRLFRLYNNEQVSNFLKVHPVAIRDYSQLLDNSLRNLCKVLRESSMTYDEILTHIPAVSYENQRQVMMLPKIAPTRSVKWVLDMTRIRTIHNLLRYENDLIANPQVGVASKAPRNVDTRAYIKRRLAIMANDRPISTPLDADTMLMIESIRASL